MGISVPAVYDTDPANPVTLRLRWICYNSIYCHCFIFNLFHDGQELLNLKSDLSGAFPNIFRVLKRFLFYYLFSRCTSRSPHNLIYFFYPIISRSYMNEDLYIIIQSKKQKALLICVSRCFMSDENHYITPC